MSDYIFMDEDVPATAEEALAHYGVKGMRWGFRKDGSKSSRPRGAIRRGLTKANVATDAAHNVIKEGEKKLIFLPQDKRNAAAAKTQGRILAEAAVINRSSQFKGKDLKGNPELKKAYFNKVTEVAKKTYAEELGIARTEAWGDVLGVDVSASTQQMRISAAADRIRHAEGDKRETLLVLDLELNDLGQIVGVSRANSVKHYLEEGEHIAHVLLGRA